MRTKSLQIRMILFATLIPLPGAVLAAGPSKADNTEAILRGATSPPNTVWLESLNLGNMTCGWKSPRAGTSIEGNPLRVAGVTYPHGVGTHAFSELVIDLRGTATRFMAMAGVDDEVRDKGSVVFQVWVDDKKVAESPVMRGGKKGTRFEVDLTGARRLALCVTNGADNSNSDHADWAGALIFLKPDATQPPQSLPRRFVCCYAGTGDLCSVQRYLDSGGDPNVLSWDGSTLLHHAVLGGNIEIVKLLLDHKARVNATRKDGMTPLHLAGVLGREAVWQTLIAHGADQTLRDAAGSTPERPDTEPNWATPRLPLTYRPATSLKDAYDESAKCAADLWGGEFYTRERLRFSAQPDCSDLSSLSWSLRSQGRGEEALRYAQEAWRAHPCPMALFSVAEANYILGSFAEARSCLRQLEAVASLNKDEMERLRSLRHSLSVTTYRCTWEIPTGSKMVADMKNFGWGTRPAIPLPADTAFQKLLSYRLEGAAKFEEKRDSLGNRYIEAIPVPGQNMKLVVEWVRYPYSWRDLLRSYRPSPLPDETKPYLIRSVSDDAVTSCDPTSKRVRRLLKALKGQTDIETIENISHWLEHVIGSPADPINASDSEVTLSSLRGHCESWASAMVALVRAAGIPARFVRGFPLLPKEPTSGGLTFHTVPDIYINGVGWVEWSCGTPWMPLGHAWVRSYSYDSPGCGEPMRLGFLDGGRSTGSFEIIDERLQQ